MTNIYIKIGNPFFLDDTSEESKRRYEDLQRVAIGHRIEVVEVKPKSVTITGYGVTRTRQIPKNASFTWLLDRIREHEATTHRTFAYKNHKRIKDFYELAERVVKDGGFVDIDYDKLFIRRGTFEAVYSGGFRALPVPIRADFMQLIERSAKNKELQRVKELAKQHGLI